MMERRGAALKKWRLSQTVGGRAMSLEAAAQMLGVTRSAWNDWEKGKRCPAYGWMIEIYSLTEGRVQPNDFYDLPELRRRAA